MWCKIRCWLNWSCLSQNREVWGENLIAAFAYLQRLSSANPILVLLSEKIQIFFSKVYRERSRGNGHKLQKEKFQQDKIMLKKCCRWVKHWGMRLERWQILHYQKTAKNFWARPWGILFISVVLLQAGWISWLQKSFSLSCFVVLFWVAQSLSESLPPKFWGKRSDSFYHQIANRFWKGWFCLELLDQQKINKLMQNVHLLCPVY